MTEIDARIRTLLAPRYRVVGPLGVGGMASVYEAIDASGERVAIKVLHGHLDLDDTVRARFVREAEVLTAISHPNVVAVRAVIAEVPCLVMELAQGELLSGVLAREAPLAPPRAISIALDVLGALGAVHGIGAVHRDLKPDNLLVTPEGAVKLFDFGVASLEGSPDLTPPGTTMGTPHYASPERLLGEAARDPRGDLYSAAVLLFEMVTGERPFQGETYAEICDRVVGSTPPSLALFLRDPPVALDGFLARALAKDPADRFSTAEAMASALREAAANCGFLR